VESTGQTQKYFGSNFAGKKLHLEDALRRESELLQPARWNQQGRLLDASIEHIPRKKPKTLLREQGTLAVNQFDLERRHALFQSRACPKHSCFVSLDRTYVPAFPSDFRVSIDAICKNELKICIIITIAATP
jgi:hypothetical protein